MKYFDKEYYNKWLYLVLSNSDISFNFIIIIKDFELFWYRKGYAGKYLDITIFGKRFNIYNKFKP